MGSILTILTAVFVTLKVTHQVDWSWWWVLSPVWIPIAFTLAVLAIGAIMWAIVELVKGGDK